jgi:hypothetical protein
MTTPNRFDFVGEWKFVGEGRVVDNYTGEEVNAKLRFKAINIGVETTELESGRDVKLNNKFIADETGTVWDLVILDGE